MEKKIKVFGYGNLLNPELYNNLGCEILSVTECMLFTFLRVFNFYDKDKKLTLLNIDKSDLDKLVWGVAIEIYQKDLPKFVNCESGDEIVMADFETAGGDRLRAMLFRAEHFEADDFDFKSIKQKEYLDGILKSIKIYSKEFQINFRKTTYIGNQTLFELGY